MEQVCNDYAIMPILVFIKNSIHLIQIIVPIILIIMASIKIAQLVRNPDKKDGLKSIRIIFTAAFIVFVVPLFVDILFQIIGNKTTFSSCWNNSDYSIATKYIDIYNTKKNKIFTDPSDYEKGTPSNNGTCLNKNKTTKVLFVGNSKTYVQSIPTKFQNIAANNGYRVSVTSVTEGGQPLHYLASTYKSKIISQAYDCVILQERTSEYESAGSSYENGVVQITKLVRSKNPNVKTYVRALWIKSDLSSSSLNKSYKATEKYASKTSSGVIYDGKAFQECKKTYPSINLFMDDRHQSAEGAYLSAMVIFKTLSNEDPTKTTYYSGLDKNKVLKLQQIAAK